MLNSLQRIWGLVLKELIQFKRDKVLLIFVLVGPLVELLLMGGLTGGGIENLPLALVDMDHSRASRELTTLLDQTDELLLSVYDDNVAYAEQLMQQGEISVVIVIPPGYGEQLTNPQQGAAVQVIADGTNYVVSTVSISTAETVAAEIMQDLAARYSATSAGPIDLRFTARFNPALDGQPHSITMMLGLIIYQVALIISAQSFTRERDLGTMEQLRVTPLGRVEMILGKAIPVLFIGLVDCLLMTVVVTTWFDIPMRGSFVLLLLMAVPFVMVQIGWGTLISLVSRNQQQAMMMVFALAMLEIACSGFMVPASTMPPAMQLISQFSSVNHFMRVTRGIMLRGAGLNSLWAPALALTGLAAAVMTLAWLRLRAGLDANSLQRRIRASLQARSAARQAQKRRTAIPEPVLRLTPSPVPTTVEPPTTPIATTRRRR